MCRLRPLLALQKHGLILANGVGVIDATTRDRTTRSCSRCGTPATRRLAAGTRVAQASCSPARASRGSTPKPGRHARRVRLDGTMAYLDIVRRILAEGERKAEPHRRRLPIAIAGAMFEHDMANGFPLLTTKKTPLFSWSRPSSSSSCRGLTDESVGCRSSDRTTSGTSGRHPRKAPYGHDAAATEADDGRARSRPGLRLPVAAFRGAATSITPPTTRAQGVDQLPRVVDTLQAESRTIAA